MKPDEHFSAALLTTEPTGGQNAPGTGSSSACDASSSTVEPLPTMRVETPSTQNVSLASAPARPAPSREVICAEALSFLAAHPAQPGTSVITSLPDLSELPELSFEAWRAWFQQAARAVLAWTPSDGLSLFFQSDIRYRGVWVDKGYWVQRAAEDLGLELVFHKIVCRKPPGTITHGRASYSHLLCFSKHSRGMPRAPGPDVLADAGAMPWSKAMGENACHLACRYLASETSTHLVVDPFCGHGTVLAVANQYGFSALGIDISQRKCRAARRLQLKAGEVPATSPYPIQA